MCHPLDTCKARIQAPPSFGHQATSVWQCFRNTLSTEGLAGLYRGIGVVTVGGVPGACMYFTSYEVCASYIRCNPDGPQVQRWSTGVRIINTAFVCVCVCVCEILNI